MATCLPIGAKRCGMGRIAILNVTLTGVGVRRVYSCSLLAWLGMELRSKRAIPNTKLEPHSRGEVSGTRWQHI
jgi:hypothetical protein